MLITSHTHQSLKEFPLFSARPHVLDQKILIIYNCDDKTIWDSPFVPPSIVSQQVHPLRFFFFAYQNQAAHADASKR